SPGVLTAPTLDLLVAELGGEPTPVPETPPPVGENGATRFTRWLDSLNPAAARNLRFLLRRISETEEEQALLADALAGANSLDEVLPKLAELQTIKIRNRLRPGQPTVAIYFPGGAYREQAG